MVFRTDPDTSAEALLAAESSALRLEQIPADVVDAAVDCVIDTLAVSLGGASEEVVRLTSQIADDEGSCTRFDGTRAGARSSALINGTAAHVLDFDDWLPAARVHPSAPLLPAVLAQAQTQDAADLTGSDTIDLLTAYIAGFEAQARIGVALAPGHYEAGFHPTATVGIFGAATGAAHLLGLGPAGFQRAWGLAATQAAGLRAVFGTMGKSLHVGRASEAGLLSAQLVAAGATAPDDAIFGLRGFAVAHGHKADVEPVKVPFAEKWYLREVQVKRHAACFGTHAAIDALLTLRESVDLERIREIELTVSELLQTVCAIPVATTPLEGKFSLTFTAALALVRGSCQVADFTHESVHDPRLRSVAERVRVRFDPSLPAQQTHVRLLLEDGETLEHSADSAVLATPGERRLIVREKLRALATPVLGVECCTALLTAIENLSTGGGVADLTALLHSGLQLPLLASDQAGC